MLKCPEIVTGKSPFAPISICSGNSKRKKKPILLLKHTKKLMNKRNDKKELPHKKVLIIFNLIKKSLSSLCGEIMVAFHGRNTKEGNQRRKWNKIRFDWEKDRFICTRARWKQPNEILPTGVCIDTDLGRQIGNFRLFKIPNSSAQVCIQ